MKWLILIYNILDWLHDKILHPIFKDEPDIKSTTIKRSKKRNFNKKKRNNYL